MFNVSQLRSSPVERLPSFDELIAQEEETGPPRVLYTEYLQRGDPRESQFDDAKRKELLGLIDRGTFRLVLTEEAEDKPNIVPSRFVLAIKNRDSDDPVFKARFVLGGHRDRDKNNIVHNTVNLKQSSVRTIMALATILGFEIWSLDVKQAYLQSTANLQRKAFLRPRELNLGKEELLQIIKPLYGLTDSGDYWCETFARFHLHDLRMVQSTGDFVLFFRRIADKLVCYEALSGSYVEDVLQAGKPETKQLLRQQIRDKFDITWEDLTEFVYTGILCDTSNPELRALSQKQYIKRLQKLPTGAIFAQYRSLRARIMWVVHTRPDIACEASMASQVVEASFSSSDVKNINSVAKYLKFSPDFVLRLPKLDLDTLRLVVYSDASLSNRDDNRSQLGFIICLADNSNKCSILHYSSQKSSRVTRSSSGSETIAFVDSFGNAFLIRHDLERMLGQKLPIVMMKDSIQLFYVLVRNKYTTEKRLMVDVAAIREAYSDHTISNVALIKSEHSPADVLTKLGGHQALLRLLRMHRISHPVVQYVVQTTTA